MLAKDEEVVSKLFTESVRSLMEKGYSRVEAESVVQAKMDSDDKRDRDDAMRMDDTINKIDERRTAQLITFATVLMTVVGVLIAQDDILSSLYTDQEILIASAFTLLFFSILAGIAQSIIDRGFWKKTQALLLHRYIVIGKLIHNGKITSFEQKTTKENEYLADFPKGTSMMASQLQLGLLSLGFVAFMLILLTIMVN